MKKKNAVAVSSKNYSITNRAEMVIMANTLKEFVIAKDLFSEIKGKKYIHIEGWQFALQSMGLFPLIKEVKDISDGSTVKWFVEAEILNIKTNQIMGKGFALCSSKESSKKAFDEYAILSMAQTRAIGKASRNLVGWIMKLAGYEGTPSEEMTKFGGEIVKTVDQEQTSKNETPDNIIYCHGARKGGCPDGASINNLKQVDFTTSLYKKPLCRNCYKEMQKINPIKVNKKK